MAFLPRGQRHRHAGMSLDLPRGTARRALESARGAEQAEQVVRLAEPRPAAPFAAQGFALLGGKLRAQDFARALELNSIGVERQREQSREVIAVDPQDIVLTPRLLDPQFGPVS